MKRLVVCCDGTWQNLEKDYPTNVVKITQAIKPLDSEGIHQVVYYDEGIGAESNISPEEDLTVLGAGHREQLLEGIKGGGFGKGIDKNIRDAYRFLTLNYAPGDEIFLFGFSRGSYTVRSLAGMLAHCGLIKRPHLRHIGEAYENYRQKIQSESAVMAEFRQQYCHLNSEYNNRVPITLLGCWDTVGSLGIPNVTLDITRKNIPVASRIPDLVDKIPIDKLINRDRYAFHDTTLSTIVQHALHAVAVDEDRDTFSVTLMEKHPDAKEQTLKQVWFPGGHGCVGGGTKPESKLADNALLWMMESIKEIGLNLEFAPEQIPQREQIAPDAAFDYLQDPEQPKDQKLLGRLKGKAKKVKGAVRKTAINLPGKHLREIPAEDGIHRSVSERWHAREDYEPENVDKNRILSNQKLAEDKNILLVS